MIFVDLQLTEIDSEIFVFEALIVPAVKVRREIDQPIESDSLQECLIKFFYKCE